MPSLEQMEHLLASLQGVISARVVTASDGRPLEIHVLATAELHPKQVVRNIESALSAGLGLDIDRRIVSVSQPRPGTEPPLPPSRSSSSQEASAGSLIEGGAPGRNGQPAAASPSPRGAGAKGAEGAPRVTFAGFSSRSRSARETVCEVRLQSGGREVTGSAEGPDTPQGRAEAGARAAFEALGRSAPGAELVFEGVALVNAHGRTYVLVSAQALEGREPTALMGAALLERSPEEAAVLATLQATNRLAGRNRPRTP